MLDLKKKKKIPNLYKGPFPKIVGKGLGSVTDLLMIF
jgi:hypothetical protein